MRKRMKYSAYLTPVNGGYKVRSFLHDGSEIIIHVGEHDVALNEATDDKEVEGFVFVEQLGVQGTRAYIELPQASIEHGNLVTVNKFKLVDPAFKIEDYIVSTSKIPKTRQKKSGV